MPLGTRRSPRSRKRLPPKVRATHASPRISEDRERRRPGRRVRLADAGRRWPSPARRDGTRPQTRDRARPRLTTSPAGSPHGPVRELMAVLRRAAPATSSRSAADPEIVATHGTCGDAPGAACCTRIVARSGECSTSSAALLFEEWNSARLTNDAPRQRSCGSVAGSGAGIARTRIGLRWC